MRQTVICGSEEWEVVPFLPYVREGLCTSITVTVDQEAELWWVVAGIEITVTLHVDPATSATASGTYTRTELVERVLLNPALLEENLEFPGFDADSEQTVPPFEAGCFSYTFNAIEGTDDVFASTELSVTLNLFGGGYASGGAGLAVVSFKLRFSMIYDDGTEGTILIQSVPTDDDPDPFDGIYSQTTTASFLGNTVAVKCGDTAAGPAGPSTYFFGGVAPDISLVPKLWFEHRTKEGADPIYDPGTGAQLRDPRTRLE